MVMMMAYRRRAVAPLVVGLLAAGIAPAEAQQPVKAADLARFFAGAAAGLGAHEAGHLIFDIVFDARPGLQGVRFGGIPFFAITHRSDLSPRREFTVSSAGFWMQHATSELLLTREPDLRHGRAPFRKGMLAFNVIGSVAYSVAAFGRIGPLERDTRAMAAASGVDEPIIGAMVLVPAVLDAYRYIRPGTKWAIWGSRAMKIGMVLLVIKNDNLESSN